MDANGLDSKTEISQQQAEAMKKRYLEFQEKFSNDRANFLNTDENIYYLVSKKFLEQWKQYCLSIDHYRRVPDPMNSDLLDPNTHKLKQGLVQSDDFQIVNCEVYELFGEYRANEMNTLKRIAYQQNGEKKVPIYLTNIPCLPIKKVDLEMIDRKQLLHLGIIEYEIVSINNSIKDFLFSIKEQLQLHKKYKLRCWLNKSQLDLKELWRYLAKQMAPQCHWNLKIKGVGKLIEDEKVPLASIGLQEGDYLIVECSDHDNWFFRSSDEAKCHACYKIRKISHFCGCLKVGYCSKQCQQKDLHYHYRQCKYLEQQEANKKMEMPMTDTSIRGLAGLSNLGNTCFMNSCLQCLSHTMPLTEYFLSQIFEEQINKVNPLGTKGKLARSYATFIKNMWCLNSRVYSPYNLKSAVASINQMFSGYAQHDSQQFFSFLVDGLHEDLNRIQDKPYIQSVDSKQRPDSVVALQSWLAHVQRNQSIIVDTMTGQYKSKVTCPNCKKQSITFDPFITVTLPIPSQSTAYQMSFYVIFEDHKKSTTKKSIMYQKANTDNWLEQVTKQLNRQKHQFKFYVLTFQENIYDFKNTEKSQLFSKIRQEKKSIFLLELSPEEQEWQDQLQLVFRFSKRVQEKWDSLWFKRPFWFPKCRTTGRKIFERVLKYLYHQAYDKNLTVSPKQNNYEAYTQKMFKNRPFTLFLRYNKTIRKQSQKISIDFEKQAPIQDDKNIDELFEQFQITNIKEIEVDVKFNNFGLDSFNIDRLKMYNEEQKQKKYSQYSRKKASVTLDQCFQVFEEPQQLERGNEWYCSNCRGHKLATKQFTIYKAPEILIIHLKRFKSKGNTRKQKNDTVVDFPHELNIEKYVIDPKPINSYIPEVKKAQKYKEPKYNIKLSDEPNTNYQLYAISNHYGGLGSGHYTAYAKNNGKWYSFNDSSVSAVDQNSIRGSGAYMLFYKRKQRS